MFLFSFSSSLFSTIHLGFNWMFCTTISFSKEFFMEQRLNCIFPYCVLGGTKVLVICKSRHSAAILVTPPGSHFGLRIQDATVSKLIFWEPELHFQWPLGHKNCMYIIISQIWLKPCEYFGNFAPKIGSKKLSPPQVMHALGCYTSATHTQISAWVTSTTWLAWYVSQFGYYNADEQLLGTGMVYVDTHTIFSFTEFKFSLRYTCLMTVKIWLKLLHSTTSQVKKKTY